MNEHDVGTRPGYPVRVAGVLARAVGDDVVVIHPGTQQAYALTGVPARIWESLDGSPAPMVSRAEFDEAVAVLVALDLVTVDAPGVSRRSMLQRSGLVLAGAGVASIALPEALAAASPVDGMTKSTPGPISFLVPAGKTKISFVLVGGGGGGGTTSTGNGGDGGAPQSVSGTITLPTNPTGTTLVGWVGGGGGAGTSAGGPGGLGAATGTYHAPGDSGSQFTGTGGGGGKLAGGGGAASFVAIGGAIVVIAGGGGGGGAGSTNNNTANDGGDGGYHTSAPAGVDGADGSGNNGGAGGAAGANTAQSGAGVAGSGSAVDGGGGGGGGYDGGGGGTSAGAKFGGGGGGQGTFTRSTTYVVTAPSVSESAIGAADSVGASGSVMLTVTG